MTDDQHDHAPERDDEVQAILAPSFVQPVFHLNGGPAQFDPASYADGRGSTTDPDVVRGLTTREVLAREARSARQAPQEAPAPAPAPQAPAEAPPAPPAAPQGPVPALSGTFALFITPANGMVLAYRPEGADQDKHLEVPPFLVQMVARQTGHAPEDVLYALAEGMR